jgi:hypothetical protein
MCFFAHGCCGALGQERVARYVSHWAMGAIHITGLQLARSTAPPRLSWPICSSSNESPDRASSFAVRTMNALTGLAHLQFEQ